MCVSVKTKKKKKKKTYLFVVFGNRTRDQRSAYSRGESVQLLVKLVCSPEYHVCGTYSVLGPAKFFSVQLLVKLVCSPEYHVCGTYSVLGPAKFFSLFFFTNMGANRDLSR